MRWIPKGSGSIVSLWGGNPDDGDRKRDVLGVCLRCRKLAEAGRKLFGVSRGRRTTANDADRLRKHLARFGLEWARVGEARADIGTGQVKLARN